MIPKPTIKNPPPTLPNITYFSAKIIENFHKETL
jgi:hypothetical protein